MSTDPWSRYVKRLECDLPPWEARFVMSRSNQLALATTGLRTAVALNAGALVALPALVEIAGITPGDLPTAMWIFVAGVLMASIAIVVGYMGQHADGNGVDCHIRHLRSTYRTEHLDSIGHRDKTPEEERRAIAGLEDERDRHYRRAHRLQLAALQLAWASLVAFLAGCILATA